MPRLPGIETVRQVNPQILRTQALSAPRNAGAVGEAIATGGANLSAQFAKDAERIANEDAEREARNLDTEYSRGIRLRLHGDGTEENPGFLNQRGENAIQSRQAFEADLEAFKKQMLGKASNDRVRRAIEGAFANRLESTLSRGAIHSEKERNVANDAAIASRKQELQDSAAADPARVDLNARLIQDEAERQAMGKGLGKEAAKTAGQIAATGIHIAEITRLSSIDADLARQHFEKNKARIDGTRHNDIETILKGGEVRQWAQGVAETITSEGGTLSERLAKARKAAPTAAKQDELVARVQARFQEQERSDSAELLKRTVSTADSISAGGATIGAQLALAKDIKDPRVRTAVEARLKANEATRKSLATEKLKKLKIDATNLARAGKFDEIPSNVLAEFGGVMTSTLERISSRVNRGAPIESKPEVENKLNKMSPEELAAVDLVSPEFLGGLSSTRWQSWSDRQGALARAGESSVKTAMRTRSQIVTQDLKAAEIKSAEDIALFNRRIDEEIEALETRTGKKAGSADIQGISDRLLVSGEIRGSSFLGIGVDPNRRAFQVKPGEEFFIEEITDIPQSQIEDLRAAFKRANRRDGTNDELVEIYNEFLSSGR